MGVAYFLSYSKKAHEDAEWETGALLTETHPIRWLNEQQKKAPQALFKLESHGMINASKATLDKLKATGMVKR